MDETRGKRVAAALADFSARPPARGPGGDPEWPVELFHRAAGSVPAYREFLREHGADPATVRTLDGFARLPLMTKENYHTKYPLAERCRDGRLDSCDMIAVSSGSTGHPTYWPRFVLDELSVATRFEQVFRDSFGADSTTTLAVVCFPLGTWVGGLYTAACCRHLAAKGYPITVVAPGNNKDEILRVVPDLAAGFEQTVLLGYPPFLKDVVDTGNARGIGWPAMNIKLVLAGEVFSEDWRDLMGERAGMTRPAYDSAALYGTADGGVLGNETPLSITVRRFLARTPGRGAGTVRLGPAADPGPVRPGQPLLRAARRHAAVHRGQRRPADPLPHRRRGRPGRARRRPRPVPGGRLRPAGRARPPGRGEPAAVRVRLRALALRRVVLRRQRLPGERLGRPGAAVRQPVGHRQVRARGG